MKAHDFPTIYKSLGIDLSKLGCIMLDLEPLKKACNVQSEDFYYAQDKSRFWINGWVFDKPHVTLLYGLLTPGNDSPMKELVPIALAGWKFPEIEIADIGYFDSPYDDEPYWCIIAHIKITPELQEGHDRLCMLPHIKTFPGYKAHATICYLSKKNGEKYRDEVIQLYKKLWVGEKMNVRALNYGGNK